MTASELEKIKRLEETFELNYNLETAIMMTL